MSKPIKLSFDEEIQCTRMQLNFYEFLESHQMVAKATPDGRLVLTEVSETDSETLITTYVDLEFEQEDGE